MRAKHLILVDYDPRWPDMFLAEKARLEAAVGEHVVAIDHIGSTSIPGLIAKPVIDIMIGVEDIADAREQCIAPIVALGYEHVREYEDEYPDEIYLRRSNEAGMRSHHIHVWEIDGPDYERHLVFRDYLRAHPDEAAAYAEVKRSLIDQFERGNDYAEAKDVFIRPCEERAWAWKRGLEGND
jgi:GrpB-like predicted nucleotidyltransferase (UPF0157 family)